MDGIVERMDVDTRKFWYSDAARLRLAGIRGSTGFSSDPDFFKALNSDPDSYTGFFISIQIHLKLSSDSDSFEGFYADQFRLI